MEEIYINYLDTPLGQMIAGATDEGICLLEFTDRSKLQQQMDEVAKLMSAVFKETDHPLFATLRTQLNEYFEGMRSTFTLPLNIPASSFRQRVWQELQQIPFGETIPYKQQAEAIGCRNAVRAVATANSKNRIAIMIPCHRVIGTNGKLTGYAGGLTRKAWLINHEQQIVMRSHGLDNRIL